MRYAFYPYSAEWRFKNSKGENKSVPVSGNVVTNSAEVPRGLALSGNDIMPAPSFVVPDDIGLGALMRPLPDYQPIEFAINAIYPSRHQLSAKVRTFIDLTMTRFSEHRK